MPPPDPKRAPRVRDKDIFRELHNRWRSCALCGGTDNLSLHHVIRRSQGGDDIEANLMMVDGSGVTGCHGAIESHHGPTVRALAKYIIDNRPDTVAYLMAKLGPTAAAERLSKQMNA